MNKQQLVEAIASKSDTTKVQAEKALIAFQDAVKEALVANDKVSLVGFGTFSVTERTAREGRNPATGKSIFIGPSKTPKFKAGSALKDALNDK